MLRVHCTSVALMVAYLPAAGAEIYVEAKGSAAFRDFASTTELSAVGSSGPTVYNRDFEPGLGSSVGGAVGYEFKLINAWKMRVEVEFDHFLAEAGDDFADPGVGPQGIATGLPMVERNYSRVASKSGYLNALFVSPLICNCVSLHAGAGLGVGRVEYETRGLTPVEIVQGVQFLVFDSYASDFTSLAWQAIFGASFRLSSSLDAFLEGRYARMTKHTEMRATTPVAADVETTEKLAGPSVGIGLRMRF